MPQRENQPKPLQPHRIHRTRVYRGLAIASVLALLVSSCESASTVADPATNVTSEAEANEQIDAVFYKDTAQCEADVKKQQDEYAVLQKAYQAKQLAQPPVAPPMKIDDCAPQMQAAQEAHNKSAPVYSSLADCKAEGVQCEATPATESTESTEANGSTEATEATAGYRPVYGGTYISPFYLPTFAYFMYGGTQRRIYENRTVYQSNTPGRVVTPYGREIPQTTTGRVSVPRHSTFAAPPRPPGTAATGTIKGRSSQGFGSSFKSTGTGGK
jgi:uncharacterized protein YgiB involved in biofilm formation